jgi:type VI protein secretion system component Hcp
MPVDMYMRIDGIQGESTDSKHLKWIEVSRGAWKTTDRFSVREVLIQNVRSNIWIITKSVR